MFLVSMWTMDLPKDAFRWTLLPQVWSFRTFSQGGGSPSSTGETGLTIIIFSLLSRSDSEFEISPKSALFKLAQDLWSQTSQKSQTTAFWDQLTSSWHTPQGNMLLPGPGFSSTSPAIKMSRSRINRFGRVDPESGAFFSRWRDLDAWVVAARAKIWWRSNGW